MTMRITAPVPGLNGVGVGGVAFRDSVAETDNPAVIDYARTSGYKVEEVSTTPLPEPEEVTDPVRAYPEGVPGESWKVEELRRWATAHDVVLGNARSKGEILTVITDALSVPAPSEV